MNFFLGRICSCVAALLLLIPAWAGAQMVLSNEYSEAGTLSGTSVEMIGNSELRITGSGTPISGCTINMTSVDSWVFFDSVAPSSVISLLGQFEVNGAAASNGSNVRVVQYGQGAVVIPHSSDFQPLEVFEGVGFTGDSVSLSPNTAYGTVLSGNVSSFVLKRGYTATLATGSGGTGGVNYVAADGDLTIPVLPDELNGNVNFIRIYPWHWVAKKGTCDHDPAAFNAKWHYNWNLTWQPDNPNYEYVAIKQQRWWPGLPNPADAGYLGVNHVSGYNEPNNSVEDAYTSLNNGDVATAVAAWPDLEWTGMRVGAPAVTDGGYNWIVDFINQAEAAGRRVDYIPIHYYRASNNDPASAASALRSFLKSVYDVAHKPIWVTEFNNGANWTTATDPTFQQNSDCIEAMVNMMDDAPWIERYSIYGAVEECRELIDWSGNTTIMGAMYRDHESPIAYQQIIPAEGMASTANYRFENNLQDCSGSGNQAVSRNYPDYVAGHDGGTALQFDGVDDHVILPDSLSDSSDFTFAAWVNWDGGSNWQRIFDFGIIDSGNIYMFLTPSDGSSAKFVVNRGQGEAALTTSALPVGSWVHVAVTLSGDTGTLYVNGVQVDSDTVLPDPEDLGAVQHYLGRSMFPNDPNFDGKLDDVLFAGSALSTTQIAAIYAGNEAPEVVSSFVDGGSCAQGASYTGSVAGAVSDPESGSITYSKQYGPAWLNVAADGTLSGVPPFSGEGEQFFTVLAADASGQTTSIAVSITVTHTDSQTLGYLFDGNCRDTVGTSDGTTVGGPHYDYYPGKSVGCIELDGADDYVSLPNGVTDSDDITIASWVWWDGGANWQRLFDFGSGTSAYMFFCPQSGSGDARFVINDGSGEQVLSTSAALTAGQWVHVAVTLDGDVGTVYLNGSVAASGTIAANPSDFSHISNYIGESQFSSDPSFGGKVDDFRVYNYALGSAEINAILNDVVTDVPVTAAYWTFEEGAADSYVPYTQSAEGQYDGSMLDVSGGGNHLSAWSTGWEWYRSDVPEGAIPQTGAANTLSVQNAGNYPSMSAIGTSLSGWSPASWTIEAAFKTDRVTGHQTIVGRDSYGAYTGDPALAALYLQVRPDGYLGIRFTDQAGNNWDLESAEAVVEVDQWQAVAAVSDGSTLSLYLKNITQQESEFTLLGTLDISSSANSALSVGDGEGSGWEVGVITVGRGLYDGGHTDRFYGYIDDVRLSNESLIENDFLYTSPIPLPDAPADLAVEAADRQLYLSWSAVSNALEYTVQRGAVSEGPYAAIGTTTETSYTYSVRNGVGYFFRVFATSVKGDGPGSSEVYAIASVDVSSDEFVINSSSVDGGTNFSLTVGASVKGHNYILQSSESLTPPSWSNVVVQAGTGSGLQFDVPLMPDSTNCYFRLDVERQ